MDLAKLGPVGCQPLPGGAEMRELALSVFAALDRANLDDVAQALHARVFSREADALMEKYLENDVERWRFRPMAELVLYELKQVASMPHLALDHRRERCDLALSISGF
jgi:hypothetical protein